MFVEERQNEILNIINEQGSVYVKELSERFKVKEDSIRKDLSALEKKGLLKKTYGGAIKTRINVHDLDVSQRKDRNIEIKKNIVQKAVDLIKTGDMIFLDISTANLEVAKLLVKSNLSITVVTNMIDIMLELAVPTNINVIFMGGTFNRGRDGFVGTMTNNQIANFRFDIAFLGVVGVNLFDNSVDTYMMEDGVTKRAILNSSKTKYMMLETRKFVTDGNYKYSKIDEFTGAIMEKKPSSSSVLQKIKEYDIDWIF